MNRKFIQKAQSAIGNCMGIGGKGPVMCSYEMHYLHLLSNNTQELRWRLDASSVPIRRLKCVNFQS